MEATSKAARALPAIAAVLILIATSPVAAQQPSAAQRDAVRSSCRSDFMANCSGVQPGGKDALDCLIQNDARLSPSCRTAVSAIAPKPVAPATPAAAEPIAPQPAAAVAAPTPAPPQAVAESQMKAVQQACTLNDFMAHCSWIKPSSPEVVLCLKANATELSPACKAALGGLPGGAAAPAAAQAPPVAPARAAAKKAPPAKRAAVEPPRAISAGAAASAPPTAQQQSAIRAACRSDFMSHCSGVTPGGAEALQCLKRNAAQLSPACQGAVATVGGGAPVAASATPGASTAAPAVAPLTLPPFMRPRKRLVMMAICDADAQRLCRGTSPIGGQLLDCLAANAAALSPNCYAALARASR